MIELTLLDPNESASFDPPQGTRTPADETTFCRAGLLLQRATRMWATSPLATTVSFHPTQHPASWNR
jgi:hypothetical protein